MQNQRNNSDQLWTILKLLNWTTTYFQSHQIDSPRATAEILLAHTLDVNRIDLYLCQDQPLSQNELAQFKVLIKRRIDREPVAYIVGRREFWSLDIKVSSDVLIPRPETECLVEAILDLHQTDAPGMCNVLDLGTGSGAIVLALASERPDHVFYASDISPAALAVAKKNASRLGFADRIHFFAGDWMAPLQPGALQFDIIAANPPYIDTSTLTRLQPEVQRWEPRTALDGDEGGLKYLEHIVTSAPGFLLPGGYLALEIGHDQRKAVHEIVTACEYYDSLVFKQDYSRHDRVALLRKKRLAST